jgi:hypothetical protein
MGTGDIRQDVRQGWEKGTDEQVTGGTEENSENLCGVPK